MSASMTVETECGSITPRTRRPQGYSSGQLPAVTAEPTSMRWNVDARRPLLGSGRDLMTEACAGKESQAYFAA